MSTLAVLERLKEHAARDGGRVAACEVGPGANGSLTYAELAARVDRAADVFRAAVKPGEVVVLITGNRIEFFVAALAVWAADCALMPVHASIAEPELEAIIQRTGARLALTDPRCTRAFSTSIPQMSLEGIGLPDGQRAPCSAQQFGGTTPIAKHCSLLLQSSGTTGLPKIAIRSAAAIDAVARNVAGAAGLTAGDRVFAAIPVCHAYGIENGFLAPVWAGATVHLCDGLDLPTALSELGGGATVFPGVPFMFEVLAKTPVTTTGTSLRLAYSAGAMLPPLVSGAFAGAYGLAIGELYGASELGSVTFTEPGHPGGVGVPMAGVRVVIVDADDPQPSKPLSAEVEGQVAIAAPSMLSRYVEGEALLVDGYFLTGDLGRLDSRGRLYITGRLKQLIDIGGMKVNPAEVEMTLKEHPAVAECVVVAIPVTQTVSRLKAIVTPSGVAEIDEADLRAFARARLAGFKVPRVIEVRHSLPRSPTGKILRRELEAVR